MDLSEEKLQQAKSQLRRLQDFIGRLGNADGKKGGRELAQELIVEFERAMDDDLNTPKAFAALFKFVKDANTLLDKNQVDSSGAEAMVEALKRVNSVLGLLRFEEEGLPPHISKLIIEREEARKKKDFAAADRIRAQLLQEGFAIEDSPKGTSWKRVSAS